MHWATSRRNYKPTWKIKLHQKITDYRSQELSKSWKLLRDLKCKNLFSLSLFYCLEPDYFYCTYNCNNGIYSIKLTFLLIFLLTCLLTLLLTHLFKYLLLNCQPIYSQAFIFWFCCPFSCNKSFDFFVHLFAGSVQLKVTHEEDIAGIIISFISITLIMQFHNVQ